MKRFTDKSGGYSLVETIFYTAILSLFFVLIVNAIISFTRPYREILALRYLEQSALDSVERMTRDIREATAVDTTYSIFGTNPGVLIFTTTSGGTSTTTRYYLDTGVLKQDINSVYFGPLSSNKTSVSNLVFRHLTNSVSSAIKIEMTLETTIGSITKSKNYYSTVVLKQI
jgi:hypothetical protein